MEALLEATRRALTGWTDVDPQEARALRSSLASHPLTSWLALAAPRGPASGPHCGGVGGPLQQPLQQQHRRPSPPHPPTTADVLGSASAAVAATDYWQYGVLVECQRVMYFLRRVSVHILSRSRHLDQRVAAKVGQGSTRTSVTFIDLNYDDNSHECILLKKSSFRRLV